jgi:hypothetical protein
VRHDCRAKPRAKSFTTGNAPRVVARLWRSLLRKLRAFRRQIPFLPQAQLHLQNMPVLILYLQHEAHATAMSLAHLGSGTSLQPNPLAIAAVTGSLLEAPSAE